jgi:hypothetical protein
MVLRRAAVESPKKVAALVDLVNLPTALREFAGGRSQMSHLSFFLGVWSHIKDNNLQVAHTYCTDRLAPPVCLVASEVNYISSSTLD